MRYIKLFEGFDEDKIKSYLEDIFVELKDIGFKTKIKTDTDIDDSVVYVDIELKKENFIYGDIKEYILMAFDFLKTEFIDIDLRYRKEKIVMIYNSKTYVSEWVEPKDDEEICSVYIQIYKE